MRSVQLLRDVRVPRHLGRSGTLHLLITRPCSLVSRRCVDRRSVACLRLYHLVCLLLLVLLPRLRLQLRHVPSVALQLGHIRVGRHVLEVRRRRWRRGLHRRHGWRRCRTRRGYHARHLGHVVPPRMNAVHYRGGIVVVAARALRRRDHAVRKRRRTVNLGSASGRGRIGRCTVVRRVGNGCVRDRPLLWFAEAGAPDQEHDAAKDDGAGCCTDGDTGDCAGG
jgi:hypothetical protein